MRALRRTPPHTTTSAILHTKSCTSSEVSLRPAAPWKTPTAKLNNSSSGSAPLLLPPKVLRIAPAGRTPETSHLGISPWYSKPIVSLSALAQPILESATLIVVSVSLNSSATSGSLLMYCRSTENPTPVPHISTYNTSSNTRGLSTATYEQLYPATLSLSSASPAVIRQRIEGITSRSRIASCSSSQGT